MTTSAAEIANLGSGEPNSWEGDLLRSFKDTSPFLKEKKWEKKTQQNFLESN